MAHIKKTSMPTTWPVPRKGKRKRFLAVPSHATKKGISVLFLLRDVLKIARTKKEVRYMTNNKMVEVNAKIRKDEDFPLQVFDVLSLLDKKSDKKSNYRLEIVNKKFSLVEISEKEAGFKIVKIIGKKTLSSEKNKDLVQMNLADGQNILADIKFSVGDSVLIDIKKGSIIKVLELKEGAKIEIIGGKHFGEKGELVGFEKLVRGKDYEIKLEDRIVVLPYKTILVIA